MKPIVISLAVGLALIVSGQSAAETPTTGSPDGDAHAPTSPEVWLCTARAFDLAGAGARWDFVRRRLTGVQLFIDQVNTAGPDELRSLVEVVEEAGLKVSIECGGTLSFAPLDDTNGEESARIELAKIDKWYRAGGKVDYLNLDGPVRRLLYPASRRRRASAFTSIGRCARELTDYTRVVNRRYPEIQFFLLTNFPNWGYRGGVSYHGRGENRQDWGDYDEVVTTALEILDEANVPLAGVTVDNPYEYLIGEHFSVTLRDPAEVNWLRRVRAYEDFARERGLEFNLIINSEAGGKQSDRAFHERTLKMLEAYLAAGGRPTRYIVESWYEHPKAIVPEDEPHSLTALVKAVIERLQTAGDE
jgi:hypothetical protein